MGALKNGLPYKFYVLGQIGLKKQSDQGLRCLPVHQHLLDALMQCYVKRFYFRTIMAIV